MDYPSAGEAGGIFAGAVALLVAIGKAIGWWLGWTDRRAAARSAKLDAWHRELAERERAFELRQTEYARRIEAKLEDLEKRDEKRELELIQLRSEHAAMRTAYQLIAAALRRKDPHDPALNQADEILKVAFPLEPVVPDDMAEMLRRAKRKGEE